MHARSALFDLYGDHLRHYGDQAPVSAVVRLLRSVGIASPAVRTAISRMVTQGWLEPVALTTGAGYRATESAGARFDATAARIYATEPPPWDGTWHTLLGDLPSDRTRRERLRADLRFLGYAQVASGAWLSPYPRGNLEEIFERAGITPYVGRLVALEPVPLDAWNLDELARAYAAWPPDAEALIERGLRSCDEPDEAAWSARFWLVHEWRKFLFNDPGLPRELLAENWPGVVAAAHFSATAARLKPSADRFLERCLDPGAVSGLPN